MPNDSDVILSTYLTGMPDPQRSEIVPIDDDSRLQILPGCVELGLRLVVFHDQLSESFVQRHSCPLVSFVRVETDTTRSVNDYRFFVFHDWLLKNQCRNIFCSDGFDVRVNMNPHEMIDDSFYLWVGIHRDWRIDDQTADGRYVSRMMKSFYGSVPSQVSGEPILMAGTWGGRFEHVVRTLDLLKTEIDSIHVKLPGANCNLAAFNHVVYRDVGAQHVWMNGSPLHSVFRKYDYGADVCFVHK